MQLAFRFRPTTSGTRVAHVKLPHDGRECAVWITLAGSGPAQPAARAARCFEDDDEDTQTTPSPSGSTTASQTGSTTQGSSQSTAGLASSSIGLPAAKHSCTSRRAFKVRVNPPKGMRFTKVTVRVNNKVTRLVRGHNVTAAISLRGLPLGRYTVRVIAQTASGRLIKRTRHFVTCVPKRPS